MTNDVLQAASGLRSMIRRLADEGGVLAQAEGHNWTEAGEDARHGLVASLDAAAEQIRMARIAINRALDDHPPAYLGFEDPLKAQIESGFPTNRKERFYTATVLPAIISAQHCRHLNLFLSLCGLPDVSFLGNLDEVPKVQILAEYSFAESILGLAAGARFADAPRGGDTPDVILCGADWLVVIEAKMFHRPSAGKLNEQVAAQAGLVEYWARKFNIPLDRVRHILLLPEPLATPARGSLSVPVVTWEQVRDAYAHVGPDYWVAVLSGALEQYMDLRSQDGPGNEDGKLTGAELVEQWAEGILEFTFVGCAGGPGGKVFTSAVETGSWRTQAYEVRYEPLEGKTNWFPVETFIQKVTDPNV